MLEFNHSQINELTGLKIMVKNLHNIRSIQRGIGWCNSNIFFYLVFCTKEEDGKKDANNKHIPNITNILRVRELGWFHSKINEVGWCNGSSQNKKLVQW